MPRLKKYTNKRSWTGKVAIALSVLALTLAMTVYEDTSQSPDFLTASVFTQPIACYKNVDGRVTLQCGVDGCMNVSNGSYCTNNGSCFDYFGNPIVQGELLYPSEDRIDPICRDVYGNPIQTPSAEDSL